MEYYERDGVLVIEPDAYMDLSFKQEVLPVVDRHLNGGELMILVNCVDVELINSYGISALLSIYDRLDESGGTLAFAHVDVPLVENAFEISGLASFCEQHIYATDDDALAALAGS